MYWQPPSILKSFNFVTSSCSLSPTELQGIPFPFPSPSIVNTFLRRTAFSPNTEIFTVRPNKRTSCIFKTKVLNKCRINNYANIYRRIYEIKEKHFKATNYQFTIKATIRMRIHPASTPPKSGEIFLKVLRETEYSEWVWTCLPIVHETTEIEGTTTYDLQVSSQSRQIRLLALWYPSVRPSTYINEASTGRLFVKSGIRVSYKNLTRNCRLVTIEHKPDNAHEPLRA